MSPVERALGTEELSRPRDDSLRPVLVEVADGPGKGARAELAVGCLWVGGSKDCDLVVADASVSRRHLCVELLPGMLRVRDLDSRNGTTYLGAKIQEALVPVGGSVRIGRTTLRFLPLAQSQPLSEHEQFHGLLGRSVAMRRLFASLEKLAASPATVLIRGETGAGKEAVARALHAASPRAAEPFSVIDCAAMNPQLIESELFGHARGAFTGASEARAGAFERAGAGTILLDEVGELALDLQPKLLRVLESREFRRVGDPTPLKLHARVLAATRTDLQSLLRAGKFREDLFFRLAVTTIEVPALRERPDDITLLAETFAQQLSGAPVRLSHVTLAALQCHPWNGNVRELRNAVERVLALGSIDSEPATPAVRSYQEARDQIVDRFERDYLVELLRRHEGNVSAAAREAKVARRHFYRLLARHQLTPRES